MPASTGLAVELCEQPVELVEADAILLPVDGQLCRLGGAVARGLRSALATNERDDELEYLEDQLARIRPLPHAQARAIDGIARWRTIIVAAAYPHNVDGALFSPDECAHMIRRAIPAAITFGEQRQLGSIAATLIGTAYRMSAELAVRAFADGLAAAATRSITVRWSLPDPAHRVLARSACARLGVRLVTS